MSHQSRLTAGVLLILLPTVVYGGTSILSLLVGNSGYADNELRQDLWRAGHAHAGVLLVLSLVTLRYVDEAKLSVRMKSVLSPEATEPNTMIYLAYVGAVSLAVGLLVLGVGLVRGSSESSLTTHDDSKQRGA